MSGIDRSFRTCSNEYMMTNGESLSDASKTALELGVLLRKAAKRLYWQAGVQLNELVSLTTDSNTDSNVDIWFFNCKSNYSITNKRFNTTILKLCQLLQNLYQINVIR